MPRAQASQDMTGSLPNALPKLADAQAREDARGEHTHESLRCRHSQQGGEKRDHRQRPYLGAIIRHLSGDDEHLER
jgi:hypothetical protein